ncbi:MAG: DUF3732 domain-containing protein [Methanosarcina sp.]
MSFQIEKIILYSKKGEIRVLPLKLNSVNIITGAQDTGKSALIHIVDYCLGREKSRIPGVIQKNVSWFGIQLVRGEEKIFVARRNPYPEKLSSEDVYIEKGVDLKVPDYNQLTQNVNREGLITLLNNFAGINEYSFDIKPEHTRKVGIANITKALTYCFQEQSEIANQYLLFHRQGQEYVPQSIRDYMPFFLGAVDEEHLLKKEEINRLKQRLRKLEKQISEEERLKGVAFDRAHSLIKEAISVGLISSQPLPNELTSIKHILSSALISKAELEIPETKYSQELNHLFETKKELNYKHRSVNDEIATLLALKYGGKGFYQEATEQRARLSSIGLLPQGKEDKYICPLCASRIDNLTPDSKAILTNLKIISDQLDGVTTDLPHLDQMITTVEAKLEQINSELKDINNQIQAIQKANQRIESIRDYNAKRALIQGRISLYMETITEVKAELIDKKEFESLKAKISSLEELFDNDAIEDRLNSILSVISKEMTEMAKLFEIEYSNYPIRLNPKKLTVVADTENGPLPLEKMGSGGNWVSLHLITYLVLHRWFAKKDRPVPRFIFFDQPTQAYFPPEVADETVKNTDKEAVERMFYLIHEKVKDSKFQVIIMEHADIQEKWYQEMIVEKWWDGVKKLVPLEWIEK